MLFQEDSRGSRSGFTFIEIMLVVVIIGILVALVGPEIGGRANQARIQATEAQISSLENSLKLYEMDNGGYPEKLDALIDAPSEVEKSWNGPYIESDTVPRDSWNLEFEYNTPGEHHKKKFDLRSAGPDKEMDTEDDIVNWTKK